MPCAGLRPGTPGSGHQQLELSPATSGLEPPLTGGLWTLPNVRRTRCSVGIPEDAVPRLLRTLLLLPLLLAPAFPAAAVSLVTLTLDPTESSLTPMLGAPQSLSGTLTLSLGDVPPGGGNTAFDLVGLAITASGGGTIGIDPSVIGPLLGVLHPAGDWLFPVLSLLLTQPSTSDLSLSIADVTGVVTFGSDGSLASLSSAFSIDTGLAVGNLAVNVVAVPEPGTLPLLAGALATLATIAQRRRREAIR